MRIDRRWLLRGLGATVTAGGARKSFAQAPYPTRPIHVIVPFTPGAPYDLIPRLIGDYCAVKYDWKVVIENRPGASGIIGVVAAKQAPPDGYMLVVTSSGTHGSTPAFKQTLPYDPYNDLAPIVLLAQGALVLLVRKDTPVHSVADQIAAIRAHPGTLKFSSAGHLTQQHLAAVMMLQRAGLPPDACIHVPYRGLPEAVTALLAGQVDFMIVGTGTVKGYIEKGDLRPLAITSPKRSARWPDVPTFAEIGYPGYQIVAWCGLAAPAHTPQPILDRWNAVVNEAFADKDISKRVYDLDYDICGGSAASYTEFFTRDIEAYRQLAQATGLKDN
jgi:tripartite-type tricarboxylate transporter receptor subunit TctC